MLSTNFIRTLSPMAPILCIAFVVSMIVPAAINQVGSIVIWNKETKSFNTIWDFDALYPFTDVCKALSAEVKRHPLYERFFIDTPRAGETYSYERGEKIIRWDHFMLNIPRAYVRDRQEIAGLKGAYNDDRKCFQRAMSELPTNLFLPYST